MDWEMPIWHSKSAAPCMKTASRMRLRHRVIGWPIKQSRPRVSTLPHPSAPERPDPFLGPLRALLPHYGLVGRAEPVRHTVSENTTYKVIDADGAALLVLRVHRAGYHTADEIRSELGWVEALDDAGVVEAARPLRRVDGERLSRIDDGTVWHHVSAFRFLAGEEPKVGSHLADRFHDLGAITARLHGHAKSWQRPKGFVRKRWDFDAMFGARALWGDWRAAALDDAGRAVLEQLQATLDHRLADYGDGPDRFGLIHGDLRLANLLDDGTRLAVIDFDDCGFGWFAYDFAAAISFHEDDPAIPALQAAWLDGYRTVAPFEAESEAMLPTMIMARRLLLTAWLASRAGNDTDAEHGNGFAEGTVTLAERYLAAG